MLDSGFMLGDGVWEGIRLHCGVLLFADQHLRRLYEGAKAIDMDLGKLLPCHQGRHPPGLHSVTWGHVACSLPVLHRTVPLHDAPSRICLHGAPGLLHPRPLCILLNLTPLPGRSAVEGLPEETHAAQRC